MKKGLFLGLCFGFLGMLQAQDTSFGVSFQGYPAGFIPTLNLEHFLTDNTYLVFRVGANFTDRKDFSDVNVSEEGEGFGGSLGLQKHFSSGPGEFVAGFNVDVWSMNIDWTDIGPADAPIRGSSYVVIVQPWLEGGYFLPIKNGGSKIGLTAGFGREINAITRGDEVEQGFIASLSLKYLISI
ncbi:hypothetical protein [Flagellimonas myxillae]|uniref:hypothetical protein n=1 Tax=Flagellimonas myxillae TaxID=2942214 RepID=UPI00201F5EEB|nr:hypothetical protein [Muricauda myxillae]MCL6268251.1 hypothetical protein [Muricauda myxillae]